HLHYRRSCFWLHSFYLRLLCMIRSRRLSTCDRRRRSPPRSSLSPYTTLFRSRRVRRPRAGPPPAAGDRRADPSARLVAGDRGDRDRKSTHLNSSHVSISYAVFCLKKKV